MEKIIASHIRDFENPETRLGATYVPGKGTYLRVWGPAFESLSVIWNDGKSLPLKKQDDCFTGLFPDVQPGTRYWLVKPDGSRMADPASRFQPQDTDGPSQVVASDFAWTDKGWTGVPLDQWVIYEIHPGTFSGGHDFAGIIADLPRLKNLGVTVIEIMPVSQFSGDRNWGYDGVFPHAVQHSYGGPERLKALVDECHAQGLSIILDCVYNHMGPEGNMLAGCGPLLRDKYHTPWGPAINYDGPQSDDVRRFFLQSVWQWLTEFHFDGLRLDAVQMIFDQSPVHFLQELAGIAAEAEKQRGYKLYITGESDMNDAKLVMPVADNGMGMDAHWADDFHHCLHVLLTNEHDGYYADYGGLEQLAKIYRRGVAFEGDYSPFRLRRHGRSYEGIDKKALIVETQNHDQVGNRLTGDRLIKTVGEARAKLGAACVLLSPFTPFLFMGEEFGSQQPFTYFISHHGKDLIEAVRKGRAEEWKDFAWKEEPPEPAGVETFEECVLHDKTINPDMQDYYRVLIALSKKLRQSRLTDARHDDSTQIVRLNYESVTVYLSFSDKAQDVTVAHDSRLLFPNENITGALLHLPAYGVAVLKG